jgi:hypothetical protein
MQNRTFLVIIIIMAALSGRSEILFKTVEYQHGGITLEGLSVYDDAVRGKRPAVWLSTNGGV